MQQFLMIVALNFLSARYFGGQFVSLHYLMNILSCVGVEADDDRIGLLLSKVKGEKDITESVAAGCKKLAFVPAGGVIPMVAPTSISGHPSSTPTTTESKR